MEEEVSRLMHFVPAEEQEPEELPSISSKASCKIEHTREDDGLHRAIHQLCCCLQASKTQGSPYQSEWWGHLIRIGTCCVCRSCGVILH